MKHQVLVKKAKPEPPNQLSKEAKQTAVPGMKPAQVGQEEAPPSLPAQANQGLIARMGPGIYFLVHGRQLCKTHGIFYGDWVQKFLWDI